MKIGFIFLSTNSITLYNKYNKHSKKMTKKGTFFQKNVVFFALILSTGCTRKTEIIMRFYVQHINNSSLSVSEVY